MECGRDFDERKLYLQHGRVAHRGTIGTKGGRVVQPPSRQKEAWGTGVGKAGTGEEATEGTEVNFSVEQICGDV